MKYPVFDFLAANGIPFRVRIVRCAHNYGLNDILAHMDPDRMLVEFFDRRHMHTPNGQFVSRYNDDTLLKSGAVTRVGLMLDGGVPDWVVDGDSMLQVIAFIHGVKEASR